MTFIDKEAIKREPNDEISNIKDIKMSYIVGPHRLQKDIKEDLSLALIYYAVEAKIYGSSKLIEEHLTLRG